MEVSKNKDLEEDEELKALRLAALATLKGPPKSPDHVKDLPVPSYSAPVGQGGANAAREQDNNKISFISSSINNSWRKQNHLTRRRGPPHPRTSNLIVINPVDKDSDDKQDGKKGGVKSTSEKFKVMDILPQYKWCGSGTEDSMSPKTLRKTGPTRFNRHGSDSESSDSDYSEDSESDSGSNETVLQDEPPQRFKSLSPSRDAQISSKSPEKSRRLSFHNFESDVNLDTNEPTSVYKCLKKSAPSFKRSDSYPGVQKQEGKDWDPPSQTSHSNFNEYSSQSYSAHQNSISSYSSHVGAAEQYRDRETTRNVQAWSQNRDSRNSYYTAKHYPESSRDLSDQNFGHRDSKHSTNSMSYSNDNKLLPQNDLRLELRKRGQASSNPCFEENVRNRPSSEARYKNQQISEGDNSFSDRMRQNRSSSRDRYRSDRASRTRERSLSQERERYNACKDTDMRTDPHYRSQFDEKFQKRPQNDSSDRHQPHRSSLDRDDRIQNINFQDKSRFGANSCSQEESKRVQGSKFEHTGYEKIGFTHERSRYEQQKSHERNVASYRGRRRYDRRSSSYEGSSRSSSRSSSRGRKRLNRSSSRDKKRLKSRSSSRDRKKNRGHNSSLDRNRQRSRSPSLDRKRHRSHSSSLDRKRRRSRSSSLERKKHGSRSLSQDRKKQRSRSSSIIRKRHRSRSSSVIRKRHRSHSSSSERKRQRSWSRGKLQSRSRSPDDKKIGNLGSSQDKRRDHSRSSSRGKARHSSSCEKKKSRSLSQDRSKQKLPSASENVLDKSSRVHSISQDRSQLSNVSDREKTQLKRSLSRDKEMDPSVSRSWYKRHSVDKSNHESSSSEDSDKYGHRSHRKSLRTSKSENLNSDYRSKDKKSCQETSAKQESLLKVGSSLKELSDLLESQKQEKEIERSWSDCSAGREKSYACLRPKSDKTKRGDVITGNKSINKSETVKKTTKVEPGKEPIFSSPEKDKSPIPSSTKVEIDKSVDLNKYTNRRNRSDNINKDNEDKGSNKSSYKSKDRQNYSGSKHGFEKLSKEKTRGRRSSRRRSDSRDRYTRSKSDSRSSSSSNSSSSNLDSRPKLRSVTSVVKPVSIINVTKPERKLITGPRSTVSSQPDSYLPLKKSLDSDRSKSLKNVQLELDLKAAESKRVPVHMRLGAFPRNRVLKMTKDVEAAFVNSSSGSDNEGVSTKSRRQNISVTTDVSGGKNETVSSKTISFGDGKADILTDNAFREKSGRFKTYR